MKSRSAISLFASPPPAGAAHLQGREVVDMVEVHPQEQGVVIVEQPSRL
ncbi:MAG: hypothetical protein ACRDZ3_12495 [Acidimicrobiia bacterium]